MLDAGHLVSRGAVVLGELCFDDHLGIELVGNDEVGCLIETVQTLGTFGLAVADARTRKHVLDGVLDDVADQFADGITMAREGAAEKPFVQQDGIGNTKVG